MKRLMILGSGYAHLELSQVAEAEGYECVIVDKDNNIIARERFGERFFQVESYNLEKMISIYEKTNSQGVITSFSDITIRPYVELCEALNLPCFLEKKHIPILTRKDLMKRMFDKHHIPTSKWCLMNSTAKEVKTDLTFPVILKPLDSSGSKGIYICNNEVDVKRNIEKVNKKCNVPMENILVEEFYKGDEVSASFWIENGKVHFMSMRDRVVEYLVDNRPPQTILNRCPSVYQGIYEKDMEELAQRIVDGENFKNGPFTIQALIGKNGIYVIEILGRLPGCADDRLSKMLYGIDQLKMCVYYALGNCKVPKPENGQAKILNSFPIILKEGTISEFINLEEVKELEYVTHVDLYCSIGQKVEDTGDMTSIMGRILFKSDNDSMAKEYEKYIKSIFDIVNEEGESLIINFL